MSINIVSFPPEKHEAPSSEKILSMIFDYLGVNLEKSTRDSRIHNYYISKSDDLPVSFPFSEENAKSVLEWSL